MAPTKSQARSSRFVASGRGCLGILLCLDLSGTGLANDGSSDFRVPTATVTVAGEVRSPGDLKIVSGETLTLTGAIQKAGGFTAFAQKRKISLSREGSDGKRLEAIFDFDQLVKGESRTKDPILDNGDQIRVPKVMIIY